MNPPSSSRPHAVAMIGFGIQARTGLAPSFCKQHDLGVRVAAVCDCDRTRLLGREREGLFAIHVLAALHRLDRHVGVPVVGSRDADRVDRRVA